MPDDAWNTDPDGAERPAVPGLRVGRLLGRGGSSAVWLVTDDGGRRFALKVITPVPPGPAEGRGGQRAAAPTRRGRRAATGAAPFVAAAPAPSSGTGRRAGTGARTGGDGADVLARELTLLQRFTHDHLVRVHRLVGTDQGPGLLMDLAPGGSLLGLVTSRGPLPVPEVVTALVPVAQVLGYLHGAGALHGDVTPGNILFTAEGKPLLGDLGTGRLLGAERDGHAGTPGFLDPLHDGSFDAGADVFALAAVAWFALTGRVPGPAEQRPPLALIVPEIPRELMQLIEDALSSSRDRRPTADDFARGLLAGATPVPVDLVPAVHTSVLPELLTRRADPPPSAPPSRWTRLAGIRPRSDGGVPGAPGAGRGRRPAGGRPREALLWAPGPGARPFEGRSREPLRGAGQASAPRRAARQQESGRTGRERRTRGVLAILAGVAAVVLLIAGMALTVDVVRSAEPAADSAPGAVPGAVPDAAPGAATDASPSGAGSDRADPVPTDRTEAGGGDDPPGADPGRAAPAADPAAALDGLAAVRARAFAEADPDLLAMVDVEGSPAMAVDREAVGALAETGRTLRDLSIDIRDAAALTDAELAGLPALASLAAVTDPPPTIEVSVVRATAALSSYTETAAGTGPPRSGPSPLTAAGRQELIFVLWSSADGWRIHSVVAPPA